MGKAAISQFMADAMIDMWSAIFSGSKIEIADSDGKTLVTFELPAAPFRESANGQANLRDQVFSRAVESGWAAKFRVLKGDGTLLYSGGVGDGEALSINSAQIIKGGEVILNSFKQVVEVGS